MDEFLNKINEQGSNFKPGNSVEQLFALYNTDKNLKYETGWNITKCRHDFDYYNKYSQFSNYGPSDQNDLYRFFVGFWGKIATDKFGTFYFYWKDECPKLDLKRATLRYLSTETYCLLDPTFYLVLKHMEEICRNILVMTKTQFYTWWNNKIENTIFTRDEIQTFNWLPGQDKSLFYYRKYHNNNPALTAHLARLM